MLDLLRGPPRTDEPKRLLEHGTPARPVQPQRQAEQRVEDASEGNVREPDSIEAARLRGVGKGNDAGARMRVAARGDGEANLHDALSKTSR
jgi:hypothetical protein